VVCGDVCAAPAADTRLENRTGAVTLLNQKNTLQTGTKSETFNPAVNLTRNDVARYAPFSTTG